MNKNIIFAIILGILVLVSLVQAYQLTSLKSKLEAGAVQIGGAKSVPKTGGTSGTGATGDGLNNLPTMVGGC